MNMTDSAARVLLVEDEPQMRRFLRATLASHGYASFETTSGKEALVEASTRNPDLVLLDLGLPDMDGIEVTRRLREWALMPIIVISARGQEQDKIDALDSGADDYLTKPFGAGELLARMRVALRHATERQAGSGEAVFSVGDLRLDFVKRQVYVGDREVHLTPTEYKLFVTLARFAGRVITHRQLLKDVWGPSYAEQTQYLRVYMAQLRHKLEGDPARPRYFITEPGVGYRLKVE